MDGRDAQGGPYLAAGRWVLPLLKAGFSASDVAELADADDVRLLQSVLNEVQRQNDVKRLLLKLDTAEAVRVGLIGAQPDARNENSRTYYRWRSEVQSALLTLMGFEQPTVWDRLPRRSRRLRRR